MVEKDEFNDAGGVESSAGCTEQFTAPFSIISNN
jgi:hypothetical protein